ncbi:unnamed protein product, partial [Phaeothamnion confervicola]
ELPRRTSSAAGDSNASSRRPSSDNGENIATSELWKYRFKISVTAAEVTQYRARSCIWAWRESGGTSNPMSVEEGEAEVVEVAAASQSPCINEGAGKKLASILSSQRPDEIAVIKERIANFKAPEPSVGRGYEGKYKLIPVPNGAKALPWFRGVKATIKRVVVEKGIEQTKDLYVWFCCCTEKCMSDAIPYAVTESSVANGTSHLTNKPGDVSEKSATQADNSQQRQQKVTAAVGTELYLRNFPRFASLDWVLTHVVMKFLPVTMGTAGTGDMIRRHWQACGRPDFPAEGLHREKVVQLVTEIYDATARSFATMLVSE